MKIDHDKDGVWLIEGYSVISVGDTIPHKCSVPNCPGNINRLKLELFDEMLAALEECEEGLSNSNYEESAWHTCGDVLAKAKALSHGKEAK